MNALAATLLLSSAVAQLSPQQAAEVKKVEESLLAPCCYTQSIALHSSPVAEQMRHEVTDMVASGKTEAEIIGHYKALYGERILIVPDGRTGEVLFAFPVAAFFSCLGALLFFLRKMLQRKPDFGLGPPASARGPAWDAIRTEIERETGEDF